MKSLTLLLAFLFAIQSVQAQATASVASDGEIAHVLNRLTFGPRPGDIDKVRSLGVQAFINAQMNPNALAESSRVTAVVQKNSTLRAPSSELIAKFVQFRQQQKIAKRADGAKSTEEAESTMIPMKSQSSLSNASSQTIQEFGKNGKGKRLSAGANPGQQAVAAAVETKLVRAVESPRQLNELLADFWFNHFNVSMTKGLDRVLVGAYEEQAIRPYVFGNFRDLLGATMHHPAMMFYLDNAENTKTGFTPPNPKNKKRGINENYARELLELHTLGVDGGYTQKDVAELARVLTGWGMPGRKNAPASGNGYWASFDERRHDFGDKIILGQTIKGSGAPEIEQVLDLLAKHPSTAKHLSFQLAQYFVDDQPPASLVDKLSARYMQSGANIKSVLATLFASPEFADPNYRNSKFKSPFHYAVSALRATGMQADYPQVLAQSLRLQGQPVYGCLTPDGYKNTTESWLNPDGLLKRMDFAVKLGKLQSRDSTTDYRLILNSVRGGKLSEKTQRALANALSNQKVAALIGSPEFMSY